MSASADVSRTEGPSNIILLWILIPQTEVINLRGPWIVRNDHPQCSVIAGLQNADSTAEPLSSRESDGVVVPVWSPAVSIQ